MSEHRVIYEPSPKRIRVITNGKTVADSLATMLVLETGHMPVYYFPPQDVQTDLLQQTERHTRCRYKGEASYWSIEVGGRVVENAVWSYRQPLDAASRIAGFFAFCWDRVDHWFEEDEEIFGHPCDPYHRVDVRPSSRDISVTFQGETVARTRRGLCLFETGMPTRYYVPREDVRTDLLVASHKTRDLQGRTQPDAGPRRGLTRRLRRRDLQPGVPGLGKLRGFPI